MIRHYISFKQCRDAIVIPRQDNRSIATTTLAHFVTLLKLETKYFSFVLINILFLKGCVLSVFLSESQCRWQIAVTLSQDNCNLSQV